MRMFVFILWIVFTQLTLAQESKEIEVKSEVKEVTVFLEGAQILRRHSVNIGSGESVIKFTQLSPFVQPKSIQVKTDNAVVTGVTYQQNYLERPVDSDEIKAIDQAIKQINEEIELEQTYLKIINEKISFLNSNKSIGGEEKIDVLNLQQVSEYYGNQLTDLKLEEIQRQKTIDSLTIEKDRLEDQRSTLADFDSFPFGEILVKVKSERSNTLNLELSYLVDGASWFPSYDLRVERINEPLQLIYKANVRQNTKVDWSNVKLKFSTSEPNQSKIAPELQPYFLNYSTRPPRYNLTPNQVTGRVIDEYGEPLIGATVRVEGTSIGTITDIEGQFELTLPDGARELGVNFAGSNKSVTISSQFMTIVLESAVIEAVTITGYGTDGGRDKRKEKSRRAQAPAPPPLPETIPVKIVESQTNVNFEIDEPYSIASDNKSSTVDIQAHNVQADFQYFAVPKVVEDAFLLAYVSDWENYKLLEGEANIYLEGTFTGKTLIDTRYATDTLELALGIDKTVSIQREKLRGFKERQFIGNKQEETVSWKTTIKNNKAVPISIKVLDQIPVSTNEQIEVNLESKSGGKEKKETGEISWEFTLNPGTKKELELKYKVKFPKGRSLILE